MATAMFALHHKIVLEVKHMVDLMEWWTDWCCSPCDVILMCWSLLESWKRDRSAGH